MRDCFDTNGWDDHELPMGFFGKNTEGIAMVHIFFGEYLYSGFPHTTITWDISQMGSGIGKVDYDLVKAVDADSNQNLVILERSNEYSIEKWHLTDVPTFTGLSVSGKGDADDKFNNPVDVTIDMDGNVYVLDSLSDGRPRIKIFDANFQPIGGTGNNTTIPGTPKAIDWDDFDNAAHVLHSGGVAVFYK